MIILLLYSSVIIIVVERFRESHYKDLDEKILTYATLSYIKKRHGGVDGGLDWFFPDPRCQSTPLNEMFCLKTVSVMNICPRAFGYRL